MIPEWRLRDNAIRSSQWMRYPQYDKATIISVWRTYWWSFLVWLAQALASADIHNETKIRDTFSNYIKDYISELDALEDTYY